MVITMDYKHELIELMVRSGVLIFGDFTTKSGRKTPYFVNTGNFKTGAQLDKLGELYARKIYEDIGAGFDVLFGPAYKGITLAAAAAMHLSRDYAVDKPYCFNRKEEKDHGEGGSLVGYKPGDGDRVVIVEDVVTAGTAVRETIDLFKNIAEVKLESLVISVDRREKGTGEASALDELSQDYGIKVFPIITVFDIIAYLHNNPVDGRIYIDDNIKSMMEAYLEKYGVI
jgi:orotate phosphoribosyltransferase